MELKGRFKVVEVYESTSTSPFHDIEIGDIIIVSLNIRPTGRASKGSYALKFGVKNEGKTGTQYVYASTLERIFSKNIKVEEI